MKTSIRHMLAAGLFLGALSGMVRAQAPAQPPPAASENRAGDLSGPIRNLNDLEVTGRALFKLADMNNDGLVSQKELTDAGNLIVGGFFFRADQNGDGVLSQDEAKQARESLFRAQPILRHLVERGKAEIKTEKGNDTSAGNPAVQIGQAIDANHDKQLQASEVRAAVDSGVQTLFAMADTNRDNQLSTVEINAAIVGVGRAAVQTAFQQADADKSGTLSRAEFDKAIVEPANVVFAILDGNNDGQISPDELSQAQRVIGSQLKALMVPEAPNSPRNLLRTGASPDQVAPVPVVTPRR